MTIVHLIPALYRGGSEKVMEVIVKDQLRRGHRVVVIAFEQTAYTTDFDFPEIEYCTVHYRFSLLGKSDIRIDSYENLINELRPSVIHSHAYWTDLISHHRLRPAICYVSHFHLYYDELENVDFTKIQKKTVTQWFDKRRLLRKYRASNCAFICASRSLASFYKKRLPTSVTKRMQVISNPIEDSFYVLKRDIIIFDLLSVGRLVEIKNHEFLLKVVAHLQNLGRSTTLAIVGEGHLMAHLRKTAEDLKVSHLVTFLGIQNGESLLSVFEKSKIYVHASNDETFGLSLFEAVAAGMPVVALQFASLQENMPDEANVVMISDKTVDTFSDEVVKLLNLSPTAYALRGNNARSAVAEFSASKFVESIHKFYQRWAIETQQ